ncbi:Aspartate/glutamate racemase [Streptomyces sp. WMMB 322]|nr:Aspartate/glutamate racemase [Streptomyces sp. WMMB 322]
MPDRVVTAVNGLQPSSGIERQGPVKRRIGIVGGVGPYASLHFCSEVLRLSGATTDDAYPATVLVAEQLPSRIAHLLGGGASPLPLLLRTVEQLEQAGVDVIAIPSATTHAYRPQLTQAVSVPICDLLAETAAALERNRYRRPLFLATEATVGLGLFEPHLALGTVARYPGPQHQDDIGDFIARVKRGEPIPELRNEFAQWIEQLKIGHEGDPDPDCAVLACTELSMLAPAAAGRTHLIDVTEVLASAVLAP